VIRNQKAKVKSKIQSAIGNFMSQTSFFEKEKRKAEAASDKQLVLYALGEFQARGKELARRELPLDRLRGALRRAAEDFGVEELSDEAVASILRSLGARVVQVPTFVAKHPFRVTVPAELAEQALETYRKRVEKASA
jgi:hypothetical protein